MSRIDGIDNVGTLLENGILCYNSSKSRYKNAQMNDNSHQAK